MFIALLSFSESLAIKHMSLNNEPCMNRPNLNDLQSVELNYCPLMTNLDKCCWSSDAADDLSMKICAPSETKKHKC